MVDIPKSRKLTNTTRLANTFAEWLGVGIYLFLLTIFYLYARGGNLPISLDDYSHHAHQYTTWAFFA